MSLVGSSERVCVRILRDSGAADCIIVASVLPFSARTTLGTLCTYCGDRHECSDCATT